MNRLSLLIIILSIGLSACSLLNRSQSSGYTNSDTGPSTAQQFYIERQTMSFQEAKRDLGLEAAPSLNENQIQAVYARAELNRLEGTIRSSAEKKQYFSLKPYFHDDLERIYFLRLPDRETRARWVQSKGISTNETTFDPVITNLIDNNDISRGMSRTAVRQSWGDPDFVEVAGDSMYGNERWRYNKLVSNEDGYKSETRTIYFESGRVVGWETN